MATTVSVETMRAINDTRVCRYVRDTDNRDRRYPILVGKFGFTATNEALEEAMAYQRELDRGLSVEELAKKIGLKQAWRITERTCLLQLRPEYRDLMVSGNLSNMQAWHIAQLSPAGQHKLFAAIRTGLCETHQTLKAAAATIQEQEAQHDMFGAEAPPPSREDMDALSALERRIHAACKVLEAAFDEGRCVAAMRVDPGRAATLADKAELIRKHMLQIESALRAAAALNGSPVSQLEPKRGSRKKATPLHRAA